jgi:DNA-binding NtrC family response regulator
VSHDRTTATAAVLSLPDDGRVSERAFLVLYYTQDAAPHTRVVPLPDGVPITFGRAPDMSVPIDHEQVSRQHASVVRRGADIFVEDLGSRNGTRVNGALAEGPTRVSTGDELIIGPVTAIIGVTTGMAQRMLVGSAFELDDRLDSECDRAVRYHRPLGLAMLRLDGPSDATGLALERVAHHLRRMDFLAQYGPEEFAIILPEADVEATERASRRIAREARVGGLELGGVAVHVGLAVCPRDGSQPAALVSRARSALRSARVGGGSDGVSSAPEEAALELGDVVCVDPLMKRVFDLTRKVADAPITVLITGETGVGKEIVASAVHRQGARANKPFVTLNCSALPETLLESELFGHERGAFTGADRRKLGYFEAASGGTLFLDEVGEMPLGVQAKLLRVLEQRTITRVGGTEQLAVDVRVVCATNRDLDQEVQRGRFREDLFFRLSAFTIVVPPLRDRRNEIVPIATHCARQFARELGQPPPTFGEDVLRMFETYDWPGNVRELRNAVERAVVLQPDGRIREEHLPDRIVAAAGAPPEPQSVQALSATGPLDVRRRVADVERSAVVSALDACGGNQTRAAKRLGISRWALIRLMQKYGLKKK